MKSALLLGIACALGFSIGYVAGLPRDYWVLITIIFTVRPNIDLTVEFTSMMALGTVAGALIAAALILATSNLYFLVTALFVLAIAMFASRGVNPMVVQMFITPFIIVLLNILYPADWYLAFYRVLDVGIGTAISVAMVGLLRAFKKEST